LFFKEMATSVEPTLYETENLQLSRGQIRLVTISAIPSPSNDSVVRCTLHVVNLNAGAKYYALSYTWGAPTEYGPLTTLGDRPECPILCNGKPLLVTANLHCFLLRARQLPGLADKYFWIDAICVNQQDMRERSDQVSLMANIYSAAAVVVSWLGEQDHHTEQGFALLSKLKAFADHSPHLLDHLSKLSPDSCSISSDYGHDEQIIAAFSCRESWVSVAHVFQRTYFTRAWIIQEVVLAKTVKVLCGGHELDWSAITEASHFFSTSRWAHHLNTLFIETAGLPQQPLDPQEQTRLRFRYQSPTTLRSTAKECNKRKQQGYQPSNRSAWARTLLYTLIKARNFKATDPRDKVYALLGLVQEYAHDKPGLAPMYEEQLSETRPGQSPAAAAFTRAAIQILEDGGGDLLLLSCVEGDKYQRPATGRLPSWVPDWSSEAPTGLRVTGYERYAASGGLTQQPVVDKETLTLRLAGLRLDCVNAVGESKQAVLRGEPFPGWLGIVESLPETAPVCWRHRGHHRLDVLWRTLIVNTAGYPPRLVPEDDQSLGASFAKWFRQVTCCAADRQEDNNCTWHALVAGFRRLLDERWDPRSCEGVSASAYATPFSMSQHLRLFRTALGYLGVGSECVRVGDSVWIVPGSRVPLLLRKVQPGPEDVLPRGDRLRHRLVGGAYLHGVMEGEAVSPSATGMTIEKIQGLMETLTLE
jgi:hypothetical protein